MENEPERVLLDTHALIWFTDNLISGALRDLLQRCGQNEGLLVSAVTAWEIGLLAFPRRGTARIALRPNPADWLKRVLSEPSFVEVPLTAGIAFTASLLPDWDHADPADRLLAATARELDVPIVTRDRQILAYAEAGHVRALAC